MLSGFELYPRWVPLSFSWCSSALNVLHVYVQERLFSLGTLYIYKQKFQKNEKNVYASAFNNYHATIIHLKQFITYFLFYFFIIFNGLAINPNFGSTLPTQNSKFVPIKRTRKLKDKVTWAKRLFCSNNK